MTATAYYVLTTLGPHSKGDVITFSAEQLGAGIDISRLTALGALRLAAGGEIARAMPAQVQAANLFGVGNFTTDSAPTDGTSGTYATLAPYGAVLYDVSQSPPKEYVNTGTQQNPTWTAAGGTSLPGVITDGMNGIQAQNFTAYPVTPDPIEGPVLTAVSANDNGVSALPAGDYEYTVTYVDENFDFTNTAGGSTVTLDGTQVVQLTPPASKPASVPWVIYGRLASDGVFRNVSAPTDPTVPFLDSTLDVVLLTLTPISTYNQTFPTATFGGTEINGSAAVKTALSEWGMTPPLAQPILTASFTDTQAQLTELINVLAAKGMLLDRRT